MDYPNLIPNHERSPEELREMGRKGGIKSGESRRKKRDLRKDFKIWMELYDGLGTGDKVRLNQVLDSLIKEWYGKK